MNKRRRGVQPNQLGFGLQVHSWRGVTFPPQIVSWEHLRWNGVYSRLINS